MKLLNKLFSRSNSQRPQAQGEIRAQSPIEGGSSHNKIETRVFWPDGEQQQFTIDILRMDQKLLSNARNILFVLSIQASAIRGSIATGRVQTVTRLALAAGGTRIEGVEICSGAEQKLVAAISIAGLADGMEVQTALERDLQQQNIPKAAIQSILERVSKGPTILIIAFGPKTDPEIDEAFGLAAYLGAALQFPA